MRARADAALATADRIVAAGRRRFGERDYDDVTLESISEDAGVTVQTLLRRFGSKEGLVRAISDTVTPQVVSHRDTTPVGDVDGAVRVLVEHYEQVGDEALHLLRQEHRVAPFAQITEIGRTYHAAWVDRTFAPWLAARTGVARARLHAQLLTTCDVQTWNLLRRQVGLSRRQTEIALAELVNGVLR